MQKNIYLKWFLLSLFVFFSVSSQKVWAITSEDISREIQRLENLKQVNKEKEATILEADNDDVEKLSLIRTQLIALDNEVDKYNLEIARLQKVKLEMEAPPITTTTPPTAAPVYRELSGGGIFEDMSFGGKVVLVMVVFFSIMIPKTYFELKKEKEQAISERPVYAQEVPTVFAARFVPEGYVPRGGPQTKTPQEIQREIDRGLARIKDPSWKKSQDYHDAIVPPELL